MGRLFRFSWTVSRNGTSLTFTALWTSLNRQSFHQAKPTQMCSSAAPCFFPAYKIGEFSFEDDGVFANDPSLINSVISFRRFGRKSIGVLNDDRDFVKHVRIPALKLLRLGTDTSVTLKTAFPWWKNQDALGLAPELSSIFMNSSTDRTDLLCDKVSQTQTMKAVDWSSTIYFLELKKKQRSAVEQ